MANPLPTALTWENIQTMVSAMLNGQSIDSTLLTQYLSDSRMDIEEGRDWNVLRKYDTSLTWSPSDTFQTPHALPTDFMRWVEENPIQVWDGNVSNPTVLPITIIPYDEQLWSYSTQFTAAVDYVGMNLYFMGTADRTWTVILTYIKDNGDIVQQTISGGVTTTYSWGGFPARFHKYLPYDVTARFRLGVSYDDLAARNADQNFKDAQRVRRNMERWDANLTRSLLKNRDYLPQDYPVFVSRKINITP